MASNTTVEQALQSILHENWSQFLLNLTGIQHTSDPEVLHQARVGWRRFNSTRKFFKPLLPDQSDIPPPTLRPLLDWLGRVRDIDVALEETLPAWCNLYTKGHSARRVQWNAMIQELQLHREQGRLAIELVGNEPDIKAGLQCVSAWIEALSTTAHSDVAHLSGKEWRGWIEHRLDRLNRILVHKCHQADLRNQHKARILAKQLRYEVEILQSLLSKRWVHQSLKKARTLQTAIGRQRDRRSAHQLVKSLHHYPAVADFIRAHPDAD